MPVIYNERTNADKAWVTAEMAVGGAVVADANALPVDVAPADDFSIVYVTVGEASYTTLPNTPCRELHLINEDASSKIQWKRAGASTEFLTLYPTRSVSPFKVTNADLLAAKSETGAGDLTLKLLVFP